jgi:hypothetical protein
VAFAAMVTCMKATGATVPLGQLVHFRSAVAPVPLIAFLWWCEDFPHGLEARRAALRHAKQGEWPVKTRLP